MPFHYIQVLQMTTIYLANPIREGNWIKIPQTSTTRHQYRRGKVIKVSTHFVWVHEHATENVFQVKRYHCEKEPEYDPDPITNDKVCKHPVTYRNPHSRRYN